MSIACFYIYLSNEEITENAIGNILESYEVLDSSYIEQNQIKDTADCVQEILEILVDRDTTVSRAITLIQEDHKNQLMEKYLGIHGLRYFPQSNELFVSNRSVHLKAKIETYKDYFRVLKRDSELCTKTDDRQRLPDLGNLRGIRINLKDYI